MQKYVVWVAYSIVVAANVEEASGNGAMWGILLLGGVIVLGSAAIRWVFKKGGRTGEDTEERQSSRVQQDSGGRMGGAREGDARASTGNPRGQAAGAFEEQELRERLLQTEKKLWEGEAVAPYEKLFERIVLPLQKLLGLACCPWQAMTEEKRGYYIWDVVTDPLLDEVKRARGRISQGKLILPETGRMFEEEKVRQNIARLSRREAEQCIRENRLRISSGEIGFRKTEAVRELGGVVERLEAFAQSRQVTEGDVGKLAQEAQSILEKHGIYPMFARDCRLSPEMKKRFSPANEYSMKYPGLFIQREGVWEVLGSNIGMDSAE